MWNTELTETVYPETCNRTLESIETLFSTKSPFYWNMEQAFKLHDDVMIKHGASRDDDKPEAQQIA